MERTTTTTKECATNVRTIAYSTTQPFINPNVCVAVGRCVTPKKIIITINNARLYSAKTLVSRMLVALKSKKVTWNKRTNNI